MTRNLEPGRTWRITDALQALYATVSNVLGNQEPIDIVDLVHRDLPESIPAELTEKQWQLIRFSIERAMDSL